MKGRTVLPGLTWPIWEPVPLWPGWCQALENYWDMAYVWRLVY